MILPHVIEITHLKCFRLTFGLKFLDREMVWPSTDEWIKRLWYIYTMEYYIAIERNTFESLLIRWMNLKLVIQSEVSQKEKNILMHKYGI